MNLDSRLVRFRLRQLFAVSIFALGFLVIGCGGGSSVSVTLTPGSAQSAMAGQVVTVTAAVANDTTSKGVTWSLSGGGALSAQTTTSVTYTAPASIASAGTATITATSVADSSKTSTLTINLVPVSVMLSPASAQTKEQTQTVAVTATIVGDPGNKGVTWALTGSGSLTGSTTTAVTYNAPASVTATSSATITATSITDTTKTATLTVNLVPPPSVTTTSLAAGTVGVAYSAGLAATNGVSPYTWSVTTGALPGGLAITGSNISGTPTAFGTFNFTVQVKDADNFTGTANLSIKIAAPPVSVTTTSLPSGTVNAVYSATLQSTGGAAPITWSVSTGTLPAGLVLNTATGAITGTPTAAGTVNFTVQAADSSTPAQTATKALSIVVNPVLAITTTTLPAGVTGTAYNQTVQTNGGGTAPLTWSISSGALPGGLTLNSSTGAITGSPTASGSFNFTVQAKDSSTPQQTAQQALSIAVAAGPLMVTPATLPLGAVNEIYQSTNLAATGGIQPYTWSITTGALPAGLTLSSAGQITGTPTASGTFNFTAQVKDSANTTATGNFSITINAVLAVVTSSLPNGTVGSPYTATNLSASGGVTPYSWTITVGALPGGLTLSSGGQISGQPTASGTFNFTVKVSDAASGTATANLSIIVNPAAPLSVTTTSGSLPAGTLNAAYPATNLSATGGIQPYTWSITSGALPGGMTLSAAGQITGTPTASGTFNFTAKVADSTTPTAQTATANLTITVNANPCAGYGSGNESVLHGQYAFLTQGFNGTGSLSGFAATGSFAADGTGKITSGDVDINGVPTGPQHLTVSATGSSYVIGSDNRGCAVMTFSSTNSVTLHFAVGGINSGVASKGRVIEFDDTDGTGTRDSGILRLQTTADFALSNLNAHYAFGLDGTDSTAAHVAIGGSLSLNTSNGNISNGFADVDDGGTLIGPITGATGTVGAVSTATGRATGTFNGGVGATFNWTYYVVNKNEIFIISADTQSSTTPITSGRAIVTASSFSTSSLNGNYIVHVSGSQGGLSNTTLGLLTLTGGTINGTLYQYSLGNSPNAQTNTITSGTYTVDSTSGRTTLTGTGNHSPVLYLTTPTDGISAFILGTDNPAIFGFAELQPSANYTNAVSGNYFLGTEDPSDNTTHNDVGTVTVTGSTGAVSGSQDKSQPMSPFLQTAKTISGSVTMNASGVGNVGTNTIAITNGTRLFFIDESGGPAEITVVEQ